MSRPKNPRTKELEAIILELDIKFGGSNKKIAAELNRRGILNLKNEPWKPTDITNFKRNFKGRAATTGTITPTSKPEQGTEKAPEQEPATSTTITATNEETTNSNIPVREPQHEEPEPLATTDDIADTSRAGADGEVASAVEEIMQERIKDVLHKPSAEPAATDSIPATSVPTLPPDLVTMLAEFHDTGDLGALMTWWKSTKGQTEQIMPVKRPILRGPQGRGRVNSGLLLDAELKDAALVAAKRDPANTGGSLSLLIELLLWKYLGSPSEYVVVEE